MGLSSGKKWEVSPQTGADFHGPGVTERGWAHGHGCDCVGEARSSSKA